MPRVKAVLLPQKVMDRNTWIGLTAAAACLAFVFFMVPTDQPANAELENLLTTTMDIHDEAMAEMAAMNRVGRMLKRELPKLDSASQRAVSIRKVVRKMKKAENDMYDWMRDYSPPKDLPEAEAIEYLLGQKALISQNQQDIHNAHQTGLDLVNQ